MYLIYGKEKPQFKGIVHRQVDQAIDWNVNPVQLKTILFDRSKRLKRMLSKLVIVTEKINKNYIAYYNGGPAWNPSVSLLFQIQGDNQLVSDFSV